MSHRRRGQLIVDDALAMVLAGRATSKLTAEVAERWGLSQRQARRYVTTALETIREDFAFGGADGRSQYLGKLVSTAELVIEQGLANGHPHVALGGINTIARLLSYGVKPRD